MYLCASAIQAMSCKCLQREELCVKTQQVQHRCVCVRVVMQEIVWVGTWSGLHGVISTDTCRNVQNELSKVNC